MTTNDTDRPAEPSTAEPSTAEPRPAPPNRRQRELRLPANRRPNPTHTRLRTHRVPTLAYVLVLLLIPAAVLTAAMATGWWRTTGTTLTRTATGGGSGAATTTADGPPAAPADPADVKGSMTIQQIVDAFPGVTAAEIADAFGAPADLPASTQLKDLVEDGSGMDIPQFRTWLQQQAAG